MFLYDDNGERAVKRGQHGESVYINRFYSLKNGGLGSKHVFAGETRVVTKLRKRRREHRRRCAGQQRAHRKPGILQRNSPGQRRQEGNQQETPEPRRHLITPLIRRSRSLSFLLRRPSRGSVGFITTTRERCISILNTSRTVSRGVSRGGSNGNTPGYKLPGKELDPETGLYYFRCPWPDPMLSRWMVRIDIGEVS